MTVDRRIFTIKRNTHPDLSVLLGPPLIRLPEVPYVESSVFLKSFLNETHLTVQERVQLSQDRQILSFLGSVFYFSPYLRTLALHHPHIIFLCKDKGFKECIDSINQYIDASISHCSDENVIMTVLRTAKQQISLALGLADLGGWLSSVTVSQELSKFADKAVSIAVDYLMIFLKNSSKIKLLDVNKPGLGSGYAVLAMGKLGAGELNYSSDIDLIIITDPHISAFEDASEAQTTLIRITKSLVRILQDRTEHGYVFRTDLRLRPDPSSMPLAIPIQTALNYYEARGQNWERAAFIKARFIAGDRDLGNEFLKSLEPFIWRKYLDYAAISDIHSIKRQIQLHKEMTKMRIAGHNIKLGRGGIREIEFFVQTQQLIAGGRNIDLRAKDTLSVLDQLAKKKWINTNVRNELTESYLYFRDIEHRLQMVSDKKTHTIPDAEVSIKIIAALCGIKSNQVFIDNTKRHLVRVEDHYSNLFCDSPNLSLSQGNLSFSGDDFDPGTLDSLHNLGFQQAQTAIKIIRSWHYGRYPAMISTQSREMLTELTPALLFSFSKTGNSDRALNAFDDFLKGLPTGVQLFSILKNNPEILNLLVNILGVAPRLSDTIRRKPHVFDGILDMDSFHSDLGRKEMQHSLRQSLCQAQNYEDGMDYARIFANEKKFLIGVRALRGIIPLGYLGRYYTRLAEVLLQEILFFVWNEFSHIHGVIPGSEFAVVGMGNLGTYELTATSDLDLILLFDHDNSVSESNGRRRLYLSEYFSRLGQRLIAAMSALTSEGLIYVLDFRLRPSGNAGPLTTSFSSFMNYQRTTAWTWEHLALTRARPLVGSVAFKYRISEGIKNILKTPRDLEKLSFDVLQMRRIMEQERKPKNNFDLKRTKGGLTDIEFLAQWAILARVAKSSGSTADILESIDEEELKNDSMILHKCFSTYLALLQLIRLCVDKDLDRYTWPVCFIEKLTREVGCRTLDQVERKLNRSYKEVRSIFLRFMKR
ncbi:bifunctional [glutamine synthetase] adenylyltransferase/[glutamine synthetase]-adenylyl-L-tyrosine phosphorylase [Candidatus Endowatersipora endosymbiont of Watersipora subatra]|uniref:bifunctional [glutamine synthetase] adenylyltransferase/[glutamine synthetase]-adenylyl-L-tyrosine phosphorylase n=1 Tax=Candidatus Endowatersipora endosymbiont of Watersipora subatra TaxID=3077946 RepID=UPI00312CC1E5